MYFFKEEKEMGGGNTQIVQILSIEQEPDVRKESRASMMDGKMN